MSVHQLVVVGEEAAEASVDGALVAQHLSGDGHAFEILYREYFDRLVRLCRARTGDLAAAEDLAQETLVRALAHLDRFQIDRPMWPWLKTIATRLVIDQSRQRRPELSPDPDDNQSVTDDTLWLEERPILAAALAGVPARQRVALALRYLDDWSPAEAADALGMSRPAFDQLLFRARGKLRHEYRKVCGDSPSRLRVALWPLLAVTERLRHHAARTRSMTENWMASLPMSTEAVTSLVVAATISAAAVSAAIVVKPVEEDRAGSTAASASDLGALEASSSFTALPAGAAQQSRGGRQASHSGGAWTPAPSLHDSWNVKPAAPKLPRDYPDAGTRLRAPVDPSAPGPLAPAPGMPEAPGAPDASPKPALTVDVPGYDLTPPPAGTPSDTPEDPAPAVAPPTAEEAYEAVRLAVVSGPPVPTDMLS